ncbi:unnamed protein product [Gongylonema pulchrum]|uniref:Uncharacterized protein n=1 Tax=Gongylonema pulchrum TaxID=637853 RepID=A0A183DH50_9BILA|nr:unnamed protein product [Gongylonema pulchrum]
MFNIGVELDAAKVLYALAEECCRKKCSLQQFRSLCCTF